jgi:hypothetical protein
MDTWDGIDPIRTHLRVLVARVENAITSLRTPDGSSRLALDQAWAELVAGLALGSEPELRSCPSCGRSIFRRAVRCRYCMKFSPVAPSRVAE